MSSTRPSLKDIVGSKDAPMSLQRIMQSSDKGEMIWIGPKDAAKITKEESDAYKTAHGIMMRLSIEAPLKHKSGHPGGPLSAFTFAYLLSKRRDPSIDQPLRISAGHLQRI